MKFPIAWLPVGQQRCVNFDSTLVLVCRTGSGVFAVENKCPHAEFPLFGGPVTGDIIRCPGHGAQFDLKTGKPISNSRLSPLKIYPVAIEEDCVRLGCRTGDG